MAETQSRGWSKWFQTDTEGYSLDRAWLKHNQGGGSKWFQTDTDVYSLDRAWLKHNERDGLAGLRLTSKDPA